jgi:glyoxylase-like metal-dependent hydrolase (beta-lactamase superfamily II)
MDVKTFILGPLENNTYLLHDKAAHQAVVIDPSFDIETLIQFCQTQKIIITQVWLTHAHYDHFVGIFALRKIYPDLHTYLHPDDLGLWKKGGLASLWNLNIVMDFSPDILSDDRTKLSIGEHSFAVLHTPGHTPGHVVFYDPSISSAFCGDLIFNQGIGRTDLPGGSQAAIEKSILEKIFTLPPETTLYSGHGPLTTVQDEVNGNPFF